MVGAQKSLHICAFIVDSVIVVSCADNTYENDSVFFPMLAKGSCLKI